MNGEKVIAGGFWLRDDLNGAPQSTVLTMGGGVSLGRCEETADVRERLIATFLLAAAGLLSHAAANAAVIRCSDASGNTLYTDSACPAGMRAVVVASIAQPCTTQACEQRRERELKEAFERTRDEKEQLAAYTAERHQRDLEYRLLDEARYEAQMRKTEISQASANEPIYPAYPIAGVPLRCGMHCISFPRHRHLPVQLPVHATGDTDRGHHGIKNPDNRVAVRTLGNEPPRVVGAMTGRHTLSARQIGRQAE